MPRPQTRAELQQQLVDLSSTLQDLQQRWEAREKSLEAAIAKHDGTIASQRQEIDRCRDELHALELNNARLQGKLERVHELDPLSEREVADIERRDVAEQLEVAASRIRHPRHQVAAWAPASSLQGREWHHHEHANGESSMSAGPTPYYRRRY